MTNLTEYERLALIARRVEFYDAKARYEEYKEKLADKYGINPKSFSINFSTGQIGEMRNENVG